MPCQRLSPTLTTQPLSSGLQGRILTMPGDYVIPAEWRREGWITDLANFPDPDLSTFQDEWDYFMIDTKGVLNDFKRLINGSTISVTKGETAFTRTKRGRPETYYWFAIAAIDLINNPHKYREVYAGQLHGVFVVDYANKVDIAGLKDLLNINDNKRSSSKNIISPRYGALYARLFNRYFPGLRKDDYLKIEEREPKHGLCPNCKCVYEYLTGKYVTKDDSNYEDIRKKYMTQSIYRKYRTDNG